MGGQTGNGNGMAWLPEAGGALSLHLRPRRSNKTAASHASAPSGTGDDEAPDAHKELIVGSDGENTVYTQVFDIINAAVAGDVPWPGGIAGRAYNNRFAQEWHGRETELRESLDEVIPAYVEAQQHGDFEISPAWIGKSAASVNAIRPAGWH